MEFKVGDKAVYPAHGVGVITKVVDLEFDGVSDTFYEMKILDNGMTIQVPIQKAIANGMRDVIAVDHIERVYDILRDRETPLDSQTWNRRYREYMQRIQTGDPLEIARVLRDLALMKKDKNLSFGERKMYDQARSLLVQEIAVARDSDEASVEAEIAEIFVK